MKILKFIFVCMLVMSFMVGCGGKTATQVLTGTCSFLGSFLDQSKVAFANIQKDYPMYAAIVTGKTDATMSTVVQARAWIAAADEALVVLGAVVDGVCRSVTVADVQKALQISNETLPKTAIAPAKLKMVRVMK